MIEYAILGGSVLVAFGSAWYIWHMVASIKRAAAEGDEQ
jgi:hypothetical protein